MQFSFRKKPAAEPGAQLSSPDGLRRTGRTPMVTEIDSPDQRIPVDFSMPNLDLVREEMYRRIDNAAARGGLDAGNYAYADQWIDDQLAGWLQVARKEGEEHAHVAAQIVGANLQNLTVAYNLLGRLSTEVHEHEVQEQTFLEELLSEPGTTIVPVEGELQSTLHTLPQPSQLEGLSLKKGQVVAAISAPEKDRSARISERGAEGNDVENVRHLRPVGDTDPSTPVVIEPGDDPSAPSTRRNSS